jgi:plastocyanin
MNTMRKNNSAFYVGSVIAAAAIIIAAGVTGSALLTPQQVTASTDTIEEEERVSVGGGNITVSVNQFSPAAVEIQTGESVTFYAPQNSTEMHNVIFDLSNGSTISDILLPFTLPSGISAEQAESLQLAPPFNLGESITQNMSDGTQAIIGANKVAFYPAVVDQEDNIRYLINQEELQQQTEQAVQRGLFEPPSLSANYTMNGTETVVSSGIILDVSGFESLEGEQAEVSAANMTAATTNGTNTNATAVTTTPIPPADTGQENATTTAAME